MHKPYVIVLSFCLGLIAFFSLNLSVDYIHLGMGLTPYIGLPLFLFCLFLLYIMPVIWAMPASCFDVDAIGGCFLSEDDFMAKSKLYHKTKMLVLIDRAGTHRK